MFILQLIFHKAYLKRHAIGQSHLLSCQYYAKVALHFLKFSFATPWSLRSCRKPWKALRIIFGVRSHFIRIIILRVWLYMKLIFIRHIFRIKIVCNWLYMKLNLIRHILLIKILRIWLYMNLIWLGIYSALKCCAFDYIWNWIWLDIFAFEGTYWINAWELIIAMNIAT